MFLCEICKKNEVDILCDFAVGTGIVTSVGFKEVTVTCDKQICRECAVNLWPGIDVCPDHAKEIIKKLHKEGTTP